MTKESNKIMQTPQTNSIRGFALNYKHSIFKIFFKNPSGNIMHIKKKRFLCTHNTMRKYTIGQLSINQDKFKDRL